MNVESVSIEDLVIDAREMTASSDFGYKQYGPGDARLGAMTIRVRRSRSSELAAWWTDQSIGRNVPRSISLIGLARDGSEVRRWDFFDCRPRQWGVMDFAPENNVATESLTVQCDRVEIY